MTMMALRTFRSLARLVDAYARLLCLSLLNRFGRAPMIRPGGPIVSLTTYGKRSKTVHLTIESIGRGRFALHASSCGSMSPIGGASYRGPA